MYDLLSVIDHMPLTSGADVSVPIFKLSGDDILNIHCDIN